MKLHVMGCAGGIGGREKLTTCFRVDEDILLDAGTGVTRMEMDELVKIDHIFLTHTHLDHVIGLAFLLDSVLGKRDKPVTVHASEAAIATLKAHMFNWQLWPDFAAIPNADNAILRWQPMALEEVVDVGGGRTIQSSAVNHTVETVSYTVRCKGEAFLFTGDMVSSPDLWQRLAQDVQLRAVIIDCSFPDAEMWLAKLSKHFCPQLLTEDIAAMPYETRFLITHLKPGQEDLIMQQLQGHDPQRRFTSLRGADVFEF
jgi:3',5'-cyclic-nucleotide phosphodiesterase